eukprot:CAMPEP_0198304206 /NCGR_PEP_ID=MMETSP1449-20131203/57281_1 /TAXON_ID=420275 /ORGANISM="Attheya septentrionalis, Strain CCMP2084" /LENGTH=708 /DNA_ID=CAMNT_0044006721 /DNA_START=227 /DNA_END=2353 /DNA_ORIENTATION=-
MSIPIQKMTCILVVGIMAVQLCAGHDMNIGSPIIMGQTTSARNSNSISESSSALLWTTTKRRHPFFLPHKRHNLETANHGNVMSSSSSLLLLSTTLRGGADFYNDDEEDHMPPSDDEDDDEQQDQGRGYPPHPNSYPGNPNQMSHPGYPTSQQQQYPQQQQQQQQQRRPEPPLPGDGRSYYPGPPQQEDDRHSYPPQQNQQHPQQQQQQQQQQRQPQPQHPYAPQNQQHSQQRPPPPPLPGQGNDEEAYHPNTPPGPYSNNVHSASEQRGMEGRATNNGAMAKEMGLPPTGVGHGDSTGNTPATTTTTGGGGLDLSQFDKDLIFSGLKRMYRKKILPLELSSKYGHFHSPPLSPSDFEAKPMVLLLGQYSVGKTSFIRYLVGKDFPGIRIGPEPTTDRFVAIMANNDVNGHDKIVPGAALCSQADRPFRGLSPFGNNFLSRFEGVEVTNAPILRNITIIDTPGILSGQKQSIGRNYDYEQVMKWFAERADLIIIMFDAHKLDISDELKRVIEIMKPHADKIRIVLNKADSISTQQLMRVYGALMWSLGKVMMTPEVCRVYMGSFWGAPLVNKEQASLLTQEKLDLFNDIAQLPQNAVMRRINELVKRARSVKVHAYIIHYLRKQLPYTWGKREKQRRLIDRLDREFVMCARRYELPRGDFPDLEPFRQALLEIKDLSEFPKLDKKMVKEMDKVFSIDIPELLEKARNH